MLLKERISKIFSRFQEHNDNPKVELNYENEFQLAVAVVLSARATDKGVNKATKALFETIKTPEDMLNLGQDALENYVKTIGLYRSKSKHIIAFSKILVEEYNGKLPRDRDALMKLPGIGQKSANVILNSAYDEPYIGVDTHVFRVSHRLGFSTGKTPAAVEKDLERIIPNDYKSKAGHWMVLHGRYICKAPKPLCDKCFLTDVCPYYKKVQEIIS